MVAKLKFEDENEDSPGVDRWLDWHDKIKQVDGTPKRFYDFVEEITGKRSTDDLTEFQVEQIGILCAENYGDVGMGEEDDE